MTLVISAFPGTGKSTFYNKWKDKIKISDSDSSNFSKAQFPANYITHIKKLIDEGYGVVLVSSHEEVRKALKEADIEYTFVLPYWDGTPEHLIALKEVYMQRYKDRGSPPKFLEIADKQFETWVVSSMEGAKGNYNNMFLSSKAYLSEIEGYLTFRDVLDEYHIPYGNDTVAT